MIAIVVLIVFWIFFPWFSHNGTFSSGDWPYLYIENIKEFPLVPNIRYLWLAPYYQTITKLLVIYGGLPWEVIERMLWFWPLIGLSCWGAYRLGRSAIGALIYTTNTYALMIVGGGQMGVAMAYAVAPFVLKSFIDYTHIFLGKETVKVKNIIWTGCCISLQVMFDPRIAALTVGVSVCYLFFQNIPLRKIVSFLFFPFGMTFLIHVYWIAQLFISKSNIEGRLADATTGFVTFLSFASFSQTFSLLHPNWPENVFGKVYFMRPEFLVLPIIAFSLFLSVGYKKTREETKESKDHNGIYFWGLVLLLSAFLAKGTQEPFGLVYSWMFNHIPGFSVYRDPTKFYVIIALSYTLLIPISLNVLITRLKNKIPHAGLIVFTVFLFYWLFCIRPGITHSLGGTFVPGYVPKEYMKLKDFLYNDPAPYSTFWIPSKQRFGFSSLIHPTVDATELTKTDNLDQMLRWLASENSKDILKSNHVRYLIVAFDSRGELYITDRHYDESLYTKVLTEVGTIPWLKSITGFGRIGVFEIQ